MGDSCHSSYAKGSEKWLDAEGRIDWVSWSIGFVDWVGGDKDNSKDFHHLNTSEKVSL